MLCITIIINLTIINIILVLVICFYCCCTRVQKNYDCWSRTPDAHCFSFCPLLRCRVRHRCCTSHFRRPCCFIWLFLIHSAWKWFWLGTFTRNRGSPCVSNNKTYFWGFWECLIQNSEWLCPQSYFIERNHKKFVWVKFITNEAV